jgi:protoheme IX farnesyltransferase
MPSFPTFARSILLMIKTSMAIQNRTLAARIRDYGVLLKLRLSMLVVLSAVLAFLIGSQTVDFSRLWILTLGGFLVTGASNGLNQIFEHHTDKIMLRTRMRPLPDRRMSGKEAWIVSLSAGVAGLLLLFVFINIKSGLLGLFALLSYAFIYTPLKKATPFSVFVGAFPGAVPTLLGWVAATNRFSYEGWILFAIQFMWQFPHFWAIAWKLYDDYKSAGFEMLPSGGKNHSSAMQTVIYTFTLIPLGLLPYFSGMSGIISAIIISLAGFLFFMQSVRLLKTCSDEAAKKLMFGSFVYLPVVLIALVIDKV